MRNLHCVLVMLGALASGSAMTLLAQTADAAQAPFPPAQQAQSAANTITTVKPILIGAEAQVPLSSGTFERPSGHMGGSSFIPVVGLFSHPVYAYYKVPGEVSDTKAPVGLHKIVLQGYSAKAMGFAGQPLLVQPEVSDGSRNLEVKNGKMKGSYVKAENECTKLTQADDGSWFFQINKDWALHLTGVDPMSPWPGT